jgi:hypothetical protein
MAPQEPPLHGVEDHKILWSGAWGVVTAVASGLGGLFWDASVSAPLGTSIPLWPAYLSWAIGIPALYFVFAPLLQTWPFRRRGRQQSATSAASTNLAPEPNPMALAIVQRIGELARSVGDAQALLGSPSSGRLVIRGGNGGQFNFMARRNIRDGVFDVDFRMCWHTALVIENESDLPAPRARVRIEAIDPPNDSYLGPRDCPWLPDENVEKDLPPRGRGRVLLAWAWKETSWPLRQGEAPIPVEGTARAGPLDPGRIPDAAVVATVVAWTPDGHLMGRKRLRIAGLTDPAQTFLQVDEIDE